jgi:hypothetical protein
MSEINVFRDSFVLILHQITENSNENETNLFNIDSAHDFLFEESIADVTTKCYDDIPPGCSGEDRFVWAAGGDGKQNGKQNKLFDNVKFFGVYDKENDKKEKIHRYFYWLNSSNELKGTDLNGTDPVEDYNFSKETGRFLYENMFEIGDTDGDTNHSFMFQTVHDAGKMLINPHLTTVSNHIDSAVPPKNDERSKYIAYRAPINYNTTSEGKPYAVAGDDLKKLNNLYVSGTLFSDNGALEDGNWAEWQ